MPEEKPEHEYFDKYLDARFTHIDATIQAVNTTMSDLKTQFLTLENKFDDFKKEIKEENRATRWWVVGTGMSVIFGIAAIFFYFAQVQTSWMQQVMSFAIQAIK
ncbi:MAG: hypothetical protein AB1611_00110 [bacterium]